MLLVLPPLAYKNAQLNFRNKIRGILLKKEDTDLKLPMKKTHILFLLFWLFIPFIIDAQGQNKPNYVGQWYLREAQGKTPARSNPFREDDSDFPRTKKYNLRANMNQLNGIMNSKPSVLNLTIPYGDKTYTLNLARVEVATDNFAVKTGQGNRNHDKGVQYRGIVNGNPAHIASLSLTQSEKSAYFSTDEGNFIITKEGDEYIIYNDEDIIEPLSFSCDALPGPPSIEPRSSELLAAAGCKVVKVYFECDYAFYQSKGSSVANVTNYVMSFFNQVATLYANEDINIQVSEVYVWTTPDPYASLSTPSAIMNQFRTTRGTNFNGNLAHFLTTRSIGGGIAYVDVICNKAYAYGVSAIFGTFANVPTYSWTINVVTHELGHNLGSPHTHACSWTGGALDNCHAPEGNCSPGPAPTNGGTIMSYCHTTGAGINFNNGFGPQPGNLIRSRVEAATCLATGTGSTPPSGLNTTNITANSEQSALTVHT